MYLHHKINPGWWIINSEAAEKLLHRVRVTKPKQLSSSSKQRRKQRNFSTLNRAQRDENFRIVIKSSGVILSRWLYNAKQSRLSVRKSLILAPAHTFSPKLLSIKNIPNPRQSLTLISLIIGKVETTKMKTFLSHKKKKLFPPPPQARRHERRARGKNDAKFIS